MTLEEKAGLWFHSIMGMGENGEVLDRPGPMAPMATSEAVITRHIRHFNLFRTPGPGLLAQWHNAVQDMAARTRLGIPVMISSDPRHGTGESSGVAVRTSGFSAWPDPLGLAATRDAALVEEFGRIANQEYRAVGIRTALHPMADLATEPRWARISGTFGEDADLVTEMTVAYIRGLQGEELGPESVACMTKHFPGGGPQKDGEDAHFAYGKDQAYPGGQFEYHMRPFLPAIELGTAQIMPYYGIPLDQTSENVGMSFNKDVVTGLLREELGYDGVVCTDWLILDDVSLFFGALTIEGKYHGVEELTVPERMKKAIDAGVDQFGGHYMTDVLLEVVRSGEVSEARIDVSARRVLRNLFILGLFDDPFVDAERVGEIAGRADFVEAGKSAQRKSIVLLKAGKAEEATLPLGAGLRLYLEGVDPGLASEYGQVVETVEEADVALLRLQTPYEPRDGDMVEKMFHQGYLDFQEPELGRLLAILKAKPTVVAINLDRPGGDPRDRERGGGADRALRSHRRDHSRGRVWPLQSHGQAPVRATLVDGGGPEPARGRGVRLEGPGLPVRLRPQLRGSDGRWSRRPGVRRKGRPRLMRGLTSTPRAGAGSRSPDPGDNCCGRRPAGSAGDSSGPRRGGSRP